MRDANGTRFQLLLGHENWVECGAFASSGGFGWDPDRFELTLRPEVFQFLTAPMDVPPRLEDRRGAARDRYGNWYWIDRLGQEILVNSSCSTATAHFWASDDADASSGSAFGRFHAADVAQREPRWQLSGLAVTDDHYLVVGVLDPAGIVIFDLHAGGPPRQLLWPSGVTFTPLDMAAAPGGGVWILDRDRDHGNARYWALDRQFNVIRQDQAQVTLAPEQPTLFQPEGSVRRLAARTFPLGIALGAAAPLAAGDPIAIESLPDGSVLILDRAPVEPPWNAEPFSIVYRYRFGTQTGPPVSLGAMRDLVAKEAREKFQLVAHDFAFVPELETTSGTFFDRLYVAAAGGNQAFAFQLTQTDDRLAISPRPDFVPMRLFGGKGIVRAGAQVFYDFADRWIPLVEQRRPRYDAVNTLITKHFDSREPDCVWHRLILEGSLPAGAGIDVRSRATNEESELEFAPWKTEPPPYRRGGGSEQPFAQCSSGNAFWELLLQNAVGRWIQLELTLRGDRRVTPRLRALRVYHPRFSYLNHYLPAAYREDRTSASFVDRFLANVEGLSTAIEDRIAGVETLFDIRSVPPETLEWLAGWLGVAMDASWNDAKLRLFLRHAMEFFQYRGTVRGLQVALELALAECADEKIFTEPRTARTVAIRIVEKFRTRPREGYAHLFSVMLPTARTLTELDRQRRVELARRVVALEKPAHTLFDVNFYWALFRVDEARLGEDTLIDMGGRAPDLMPPAVIGRSYLAESYVAPGPPQDAVDRQILGRDRLQAGRLQKEDAS